MCEVKTNIGIWNTVVLTSTSNKPIFLCSKNIFFYFLSKALVESDMHISLQEKRNIKLIYDPKRCLSRKMHLKRRYFLKLSLFY